MTESEPKPSPECADAEDERVRSGRLHALDSLRGLTLLSMIDYHAMWDVVYLFGVSVPWYHSAGAEIWQQSICWTFILLSGFCHALGHHPVRRGITVTAASVLVTAVTLVFMPDSAIVFGVLTLIGLSMLLCVPVGKWTEHLPAPVCAAVSFAVFLVTKHAPAGGLSLFGKTFCRLPDAWYKNLFTALLGFPADDFFSTDYFPLIPWFFLYLTGFFLFRIAKKYDLLRFLKTPKIPVLAWLGRHSLIVYMLHQPVCYGVLYIVFEVL